MSFLIRLPFERYEPDAFSGFAPGPFSISNARAAMWLAQLAYEDEIPKQDKILEQWGLTRLNSYNRPFPSVLPMPSTGGYIARGDDTIFVVFQGTDPLLLANWVSDFDFLPNKQGIHQGFQKALDVAWNDIAGALERSKPIAHLIVTGHSLGAACTQIVATSLNVTGYGFASPKTLFAPVGLTRRPANEHLVTNWCRSDDAICYLPPIAFDHVGAVNWLQPLAVHRGDDHRLIHYLDMLAEAKAEAASDG